ncbi:transglutaminase-like cysteine peptidase [Pseudomonas sp.]|uniref:transglutaminase-like cysteine peptidase n=1 Tax=Pseudomonas sp. TaxID=306 RepID=UPI0027336BAD|nr:transglutaminase-like cysteine peptidase [Pseudomonas sp.]MDP3814305.1 transglutaminase-like cysteine peptidase [Pseudomonas sp.]
MPYVSPSRRILPSARALRLALAAFLYLFAGLSSAQTSQAPTALGAVSADAKLTSWNSLLEHGSSLGEPAKLEEVNSFINRSVAFGVDRDIWGEEDFWATPAQAISRGIGDCEDFAIAKYFSLVRMGVASEKLRLTYVKAMTSNQAHMVLAYYSSASAQPLILDNLDPRIRSASERRDLVPVYSFNDLGVFLAKAPQRVSQPPQFLARWSELSERALADGSAVMPSRG